VYQKYAEVDMSLSISINYPVTNNKMIAQQMQLRPKLERYHEMTEHSKNEKYGWMEYLGARHGGFEIKKTLIHTNKGV
jgi:hypothetical protein